MFGMSAAEMTILLIVGIVVVGPKRLPEMMRKAGQWTVKLRRMSNDLRNQSGIDRILKEEGLEKEIRELRALRESLSKHALFDSLVQSANNANAPVRSTPKSVSGSGPNPNLAPKTDAAALPSSLTPEHAASQASAPGNGSDEAGAAVSQATTSSAPEPSTDADGATTKVATGSDGSDTVSTAAALVKPAPHTIARGATASLPRKPPYKAFREREYPSFGPDHYEAFPDDLDESIDEEDIAAAAMPASAAEAPRAEETST